MSERDGLAPYAAHPERTRGRRFDEPAAPRRSHFQRDRDRIVHCKAFRRLMYKTQVFVNHEGDHFRTRLTHSLEVAQIARTIALALGLNETLTEAICLAHDLGHTPFGHAGQDALNACMRDYGGFEHNLQSLRIVDHLETRYADFDGLNLCFETREGILKHCSRRNAQQLDEVGERFLNRTHPGAEAQLADIADSIAYNHHDVDDGLRAGLLSIDALRSEPLFDAPYREVTGRYPNLDRERLIYEVKRRMIAHVVHDLIDASRVRLEASAPRDIDAVRLLDHRVIGFSEPVATAHQSLKRFLYANLYSHPQVVRMQDEARDTLTTLFNAYVDDPERIPAVTSEPRHGDLHRAIADYIAGMTDRYALACAETL